MEIFWSRLILKRVIYMQPLQVFCSPFSLISGSFSGADMDGYWKFKEESVQNITAFIMQKPSDYEKDLYSLAGYLGIECIWKMSELENH